MKYNQPYGISDPNAPYINGDPSTGIMGSIPPAASIEFPQREIVAAITAAGLAPDNADLAQLLKALKNIDVCNVLKYAQNQGTANQWSATIPTLPVTPQPAGTAIWFKANFPSIPGGTQLSLNGSSFFPVVHPDLVPVNEGDVVPTAWMLLSFDGTHWQIIAGSSRRIGDLPLLQRNIDWYVDAANGNDATLDGTSAAVSGTHGPFRTIGRAVNETIKYNMNGYNQTIHIADGNYNESINCPTPNGSGAIFITGNIAIPNNVQITGTSANPNNCAIFQHGGSYYYDGIRISTPVGTYDGISINAGFGFVRNVRCGPCGRYHFSCSGGQIIFGDGTITIEATANAAGHMEAEASGQLEIPTPFPARYPSVNILGPVTFTQGYVVSLKVGATDIHYQTITGAANVTGPKYVAYGNAVIDSRGGGVNYYPGTVAGSLATGGQYL